ncbi:MAG TPA: hypothetical protein VHA56_12655 [Mucilaginibacter sp.]|nr:hypothetical protein [Mucilaginibacter sp.]
MKTNKSRMFYKITLPLTVIALICISTLNTLWAQPSFDFDQENLGPSICTPKDLVGKTFPFKVFNNIYSNERSWKLSWGSSYGSYRKIKSVQDLVTFKVNHECKYKVDTAYTYKLVYTFIGFGLDTSSGGVPIKDSLTISYSPDSLSNYQDISIAKYYGYNVINAFTITGIYDASNNPINLTANSLKFKNFSIEVIINTEGYVKKDNYGHNGYDPNIVLQTGSFADTAHNYLDVHMNMNYVTLSAAPDVTPANFELEWTYVDDYGPDSASEAISASNLSYNFRHNATRVWLSTNYYRIPLIYERGYVVFRVRMVRPDSVYFRDPLYTKWSIDNDSGSISSLTASTQYFYIPAGHVYDKMNWQYTISFAEDGKYKHVLSYYDGLLKNRQTITRFNSDLSDLLVTENLYDFEGRPSIKLLPSPVVSSSFKFLPDVSLNYYTSIPYRPIDFDTICRTTCPTEYRPSPLATYAKGNIYYSSNNPNQTGIQKYVPDAQGYPFVQTIFSPENDKKVDVQGGAGYTLQIGGGHETKNEYVGADQADLDQLMGLDAGWEGFYRKTVTTDPNHQVSMSVRDYKGRPVTSCMIGTGPDAITHAIIANDNVPGATYLQQELIGGNVQQTIGYSKVLDKDFYMDVTGNDSTNYVYTFYPYTVPFCTSKALSVNAKYNYYIIDKCGNTNYTETDTLGYTGVVNSSSGPVTSNHRDTAYLEMGKHTIHKQLMIDPDNFSSAVDQFISQQVAADNAACLRTEAMFINYEVLKKTFPCIPEYTDLCDKKKKEMIKDLYPGTGKYGNFYYTDSTHYHVNGDNSIFTKEEPYPFRYQDTCVQFPKNYYKNTRFYGDLHSADPLLMMQIFDDTIGEMLLPLHPEYCRLMACFVDTFGERLQAIPDGVTAETQNLLLLSDIVNADPLVTKLAGPPLSWTAAAAKDSLLRLGRSQIYIDSFAFAMAYCNCGDSIMYRRCLDHIFKDNINSSSLINDVTKNNYYKIMLPLYLANRERYIDIMTSSHGDTCESCKLRRIPIIKPLPTFPTIFSPGGASYDSASIWKYFANSDVASTADGIKKLMSISQDSLMKYRDSAALTIAANTSLLCSGQVDSIVAELSNCIKGNTTLLNKIHDTLSNMCSGNRVPNGIFTPGLISYALSINGVSNSDLCNPYVISYDQVQQPAQQGTFLCKGPSYYTDMASFLNRTGVINSLGSLGTVNTFLLSPSSNIFESNMKDTLGAGNDTVHVVAAYSSSVNLYTLYIYNGTDSIRLYLKSFASSAASTCDSIFSGVSGTSYQFPSVSCINDLGSAIGDGYIQNYSFLANVSATHGTTTTTCQMLGWSDRMQSLQPSENKIAGCIPCTEMKRLYTQLSDTFSSYGIYGTDHPLFGTILTNFMNYKLGRSYSIDQYLNFMQSCAFADSVLLKQYIAYSSLKFTDSTAANTFISGFNAVDTSLYLMPPYMERDATTGVTYVLVDFNSIPARSLWEYKDFINSYAASGLQAKLLNQPYSTWQSADQLSTMIYEYNSATKADNNASTSADAAAFGNDYYTHMEINAPTTVYVKTGSTWLYCKKYAVMKTTSSLPTISQVSGGLYNLMQNMAIHPGSYYPALFVFNNYQSTVDDEYTSKQNLLRYIYSRQNANMRVVLDSMSEDSLNTYIYGTQGITYTIPSDPANVTNLYLAALADDRTDTIRNILAKVTAYETYWYPPMDGSIFMPDTANHVIVPGPYLYSFPDAYVYRCADDSYLYIDFDDKLKLFYFFIRMPKYIPVRDHHKYILEDVQPVPGGQGCELFKVKLKNTVNNTHIWVDDCMAGFAVSNGAKFSNMLLGNQANGVVSTPRDTFDNCEKDLLLSAIYMGKMRYQHYIDSIRTGLIDSFSEYAMNNLRESLTLGYRDQRFNTTLYYYDRAGNLMRTVSPEGIYKLSSSNVATVDNARTKDTSISTLYPFSQQQKSSVYMYNTRNQVIYQKTPDGGAVNYYYDYAGRLAFSQNDKQRTTGSFTYNLYDNLNRVIETGQFKTGCHWFAPRPIANDTVKVGGCYSTDYVNDILVGVPATIYNAAGGLDFSSYVHGFHNSSDVVVTSYDTETKGLDSFGLDQQTNLRKRVSAVRYYAALTSFTDADYRGNYQYATYYSYDIAGNVKTLVHDIPALASYGQRFKRIDYDYDLISGKVNLLSYNRGNVDQFYQRYTYDDDNRITTAACSNDGIIWHNDAQYSYYKHGPLARTVLGDQNVQGVDYVYTIQGWLKAINADLQDTTRDIGGDGRQSTVSAKDALALTLQYFQGDYTSISGSTVAALPERNKSLYNGNISRQTLAMAPFSNIAANYTYDQLNRIVAAAYDSINTSALTLNPVEAYRNTYSYDQDGNLKRLMRKGNVVGTRYVSGGSIYQMDTLRYYYASNYNNKLKTVTDQDSNRYKIDIQKNTDSTQLRYTYDAIGNVIKDLNAGQDSIAWNLYNKVTLSQDTAAHSTLTFAYDGAGNRVTKKSDIRQDTISLTVSDYYVRDAQGNILAIYRGETKYRYDKRRLWEIIRRDVVASIDVDTYIDSVVLPDYRGFSQFNMALTEQTAINTGFVNTQVSGNNVSVFTGNSNAVYGDMLLNGQDYMSPMFGYSSGTVISDAWKQMFSMGNNIAIQDWTTGIFDHGSTVLAARIDDMCTHASSVVNSLAMSYSVPPTPDCHLNASAVASSVSSMPDLTGNLLMAYSANTTDFNSYLDDLVQNTDVAGGTPEYGTGSTLRNNLGSELQQYGDHTDVNNFWDSWTGAHTYLASTESSGTLAGVLYDVNANDYIKSYFSYTSDTSIMDGPIASVDNITPDEMIGNAANRMSGLGYSLAINSDLMWGGDTKVEKKDQLYLSEHIMYGSSRLGNRIYPSNLYEYLWDADHGDTAAGTINTLTGIRPWYSDAYQDLIKEDKLTPWQNTHQSVFKFADMIGYRNYEVTNHLGNVQAVVRDQRLSKATTGDSGLYYRPVCQALYDYYPFGMLMPGRYVEDSNGQNCVTVTQVIDRLAMRPGYLLTDPTGGAGSGGYRISGGTQNTSAIGGASLSTDATENGNGLTVTGSGTGIGSSTDYVLSQTDISYTVTLTVDDLAGTWMAEIVEPDGSGGWNQIASVSIPSTGTYNLNFTPTSSTGQMNMKATAGSSPRIHTPPPTNQMLERYTYSTYTLCDVPRDGYRFGFNGKEKDNEIAGIGNFQNYGFREYDARIAKPITIDPLAKKFPYYSPYQFAGNNPIKNIDLEGLEECGADASAMRMETGYIKGTVSEKELMDFYQARAAGAALGAAIIADVFLLKGKATEFLMASQLAGSFYHNKSPDAKTNEERNIQAKNTLAWTLFGMGATKAVKSTVAAFRLPFQEATVALGSTRGRWGEMKEAGLLGNYEVLDVPNINESVYQTSEGRDWFWETYNKPYLDNAMSRGYTFELFDDPTNPKNIYPNGDRSKGLNFYGREIKYLESKGYKNVKNNWAVQKGTPETKVYKGN